MAETTTYSRTKEELERCSLALEELYKHGKHRAAKKFYIKYLDGGRLTLLEAVRARCYECNGLGEVATCNCPTCALYQFFKQGEEEEGDGDE